MNFIYRFISLGGTVLYVGKTRNLADRVTSHTKKPWFDEVGYIEFTQLPNASDMDVYELYYISKLKPKYNKDSNRKDTFSHELPELVFTKDFIINFLGSINKNSPINKFRRTHIGREKGI